MPSDEQYGLAKYPKTEGDPETGTVPAETPAVASTPGSFTGTPRAGPGDSLEAPSETIMREAAAAPITSVPVPPKPSNPQQEDDKPVAVDDQDLYTAGSGAPADLPS